MLARTEAILAPVLRLRAPICDEHALPRAGVDRTAVIDALERALARGAGEAGRIEALLGGLLLQEQQWQAAGEHLARAVAIDGSRADALVDLGIARFWLGDHPGAAARFEQALERAPGDAFAHYSLGVLYKDHLQQPAKALRHLREHRRLGGTGAHVDEWIQALER
jgi:tetratricopeptide (TPR) repeat protein